MYTNNSYIMPYHSKLKKIKCNRAILVQSWRLILSNSNWKCDVMPPPIKAHVIGQSLNESILMSYYLIPPINQHQLTDLISFHNHNDRLRLANQKPNTNSITSQVEWSQCRNSKSSRQKLHSFLCEYLSFHTVYEFETLRMYLYSPSLRTGSFEQILILVKNLVRTPLISEVNCNLIK